MAKGIKTGGRKQGSKNRLTGTVKEMLHLAIKNEIQHLPRTIEMLEPREKVDAIIKLLPYLIPKADQIQTSPGNTMKDTHSFITNIMENMRITT